MKGAFTWRHEEKSSRSVVLKPGGSLSWVRYVRGSTQALAACCALWFFIQFDYFCPRDVTREGGGREGESLKKEMEKLLHSCLDFETFVNILSIKLMKYEKEKLLCSYIKILKNVIFLLLCGCLGSKHQLTN